MEKLKLCPLCAKSSVVTDAICRLWYVTCLSCDCKSGEYEIESEAIAAWNTRPGEDKLQDRIDALEWMFEVDEYVIEHEHPVCMARWDSSKRGQLFNRSAKEYDSIRAAARAAVEKK